MNYLPMWGHFGYDLNTTQIPSGYRTRKISGFFAPKIYKAALFMVRLMMRTKAFISTNNITSLGTRVMTAPPTHGRTKLLKNLGKCTMSQAQSAHENRAQDTHVQYFDLPHNLPERRLDPDCKPKHVPVFVTLDRVTDFELWGFHTAGQDRIWAMTSNHAIENEDLIENLKPNDVMKLGYSAGYTSAIRFMLVESEVA